MVAIDGNRLATANLCVVTIAGNSSPARAGFRSVLPGKRGGRFDDLGTPLVRPSRGFGLRAAPVLIRDPLLA